MKQPAVYAGHIQVTEGSETAWVGTGFLGTLPWLGVLSPAVAHCRPLTSPDFNLLIHKIGIQ